MTSHLKVFLISNPKLRKGCRVTFCNLILPKQGLQNQRLDYVRKLSQHLDRLLNLKLFLEQLRLLKWSHLQSLTYLLSQLHLNSRSPVLLNLSLVPAAFRSA